MNKIFIRVFVVAVLISTCISLVGCGSDSSVVHAQSPTPSTAPAILTGYCDASTTGATATTFLIGLGGGSGCSSLTGATNTGVPMPSAGTLQNLHVVSWQNNVTVTVYVNGNAAAATCTASGTSAPYTCSDTTHTVSVSAGQLVGVQAIPSTSSSSTIVQGVQASLEKQ